MRLQRDAQGWPVWYRRLMHQIKFRLSSEELAAIKGGLPAGMTVAARARYLLLEHDGPNRAVRDQNESASTTDVPETCIGCGAPALKSYSHGPRCHLCAILARIAEVEETGVRLYCSARGCNRLFAPVYGGDNLCGIHVDYGKHVNCALCNRDNLPGRWNDVPICAGCLHSGMQRTNLIAAMQRGRRARASIPENMERRRRNHRT